LTSALQGDVEPTAFAMYGLGFTALMCWWYCFLLKSKEKSLNELKYEAWHSLKYHHCIELGWTNYGAGILAYLNRMLERDLDPPLLAFDLCEALKSKTLH
jgi:hypothetical protein